MKYLLLFAPLSLLASGTSAAGVAHNFTPTVGSTLMVLATIALVVIASTLSRKRKTLAILAVACVLSLSALTPRASALAGQGPRCSDCNASQNAGSLGNNIVYAGTIIAVYWYVVMFAL